MATTTINIEDFDIKKVQENPNVYFHTFYAKYKRLVETIVFKRIYNIDEREDIVAEVFNKLYMNIDKYNESYKLTNWVTTVTLNHCYTIGRTKKNKPENISLETIDNEGNLNYDVIEESNNDDFKIIVDGLLHKIADDVKTLIYEKYYNDLTYEEIADKYKLTVPAVKGKLFMARQQMRI